MISDLLDQNKIDFQYEIGFWQDDVLEGYGKTVHRGFPKETQEGVFEDHELV
jgi:hypothetical protein